jgi:plastocyanin
VIVVVALVTASGVAAGLAHAAPVHAAVHAAVHAENDVSAADASESNAIGDLFGDVIVGTVNSGTTSIFGWGLSAMGLNDDDDAEFAEISAQLATISNQLSEISDQLSEIEQELDQQTCDLETAETTLSARSFIDSLMDTYNGYLATGATDAELKSFVGTILYGTSNGGVGLQDELVSINEALLNAATAQGVIAACAAATGAPTAGTMGSATYYAELNNLVMYFYAYQTNGLLLLTEAYHFLAMESWEQSNSSSSISPTDAQTICTNAGGNVAIYCAQAAELVDDIYDNVQDQFALSGAPYDVNDQTALLNGTTYLFTLSLEDYTNSVSPSNTCTEPLTFADPCGPTSGTNTQTFSGQTYATRDDWSPATAPMLRSLLAGWTTGSQNAGTYLDDLGFSNMDDKILLTPTTYTATPSCDTCSPTGTIFSLPADCFADTSVDLSESQQPFCYNGETTDGQTYGSALTLLGGRGYWNDGDCLSFSSSPWLASGSAAHDFYTGTYDSSLGIAGCEDASWVNGTELGWILQGGVATTEVQYLMPALDTSTVTCTTNQDGTARSLTNPSGIPTMCGTDFDTWFASIVPSPYASDSATVTIESGASTTASATAAASTAAAATTGSFRPRYVSIRPGGTVTWVQHGPGDHTVTADDGSFDSSPGCPPGPCLGPGSSFGHVFSQAGSIGYHDKLEGSAGGVGMTGTVFVLPAAGPAPVSAPPRFTG